MGHCAVVQALRAALADHAPDPAAFLGGELGLPAQLAQLRGRQRRVLHRQAYQRQRHQFARARQQRGEFFVQIALGVRVQGVDLRPPARVEKVNRLHRDPKPVVFHAQPRTHPGRLRRQFPRLELLLGGCRAAFVGLALRQPQLLHLCRHVGASGLELGQQRVATHRAVVVHPVLGVFGHESGPVAPLSQQHQPVVAHPVFLVAAGEALQEVLHLLGRSLLEAQFQLPVGGPGLEYMAARLRQQRCQPLAVALLECLAHLDHGLVGSGAVLRLGDGAGGGHGQHGQRQADRCQNGGPSHREIMDNSEDAKALHKKALRIDLVARRLAMPDRQQRADLLQDVLRIWLVGRPDTVIGAYWPIKGEFDPLPALHRWKEDGELIDQPQLRRIGLPVVDKVHKTMVFHAWYPGCRMEEDAYGIPKPRDTEVIIPTVLFVACVGYGPGGYRLGYGGGFYDRMLATLEPRPHTVGLAFTNGFVSDFESQPHDIALDAILNENGAVWPV